MKVYVIVREPGTNAADIFPWTADRNEVDAVMRYLWWLKQNGDNATTWHELQRDGYSCEQAELTLKREVIQ